MIRYPAIACLALTLAGCSLTAPLDTGNARRVFLEPLAEAPGCRAHMSESLTLSYPDVPDALDTSRIALIDQDGRWDYYAGTRWADFLAGSIQSALIRSFSASGNFGAVYADDTVSQGRLTLATDVRRFEAVYQPGSKAPQVHIEMLFTLRDTGLSSVKKEFTARSAAAATADSAEAIDRAFEQAFAEIERTAIRKTLSCKP